MAVVSGPIRMCFTLIIETGLHLINSSSVFQSSKMRRDLQCIWFLHRHFQIQLRIMMIPEDDTSHGCCYQSLRFAGLMYTEPGFIME